MRFHAIEDHPDGLQEVFLLYKLFFRCEYMQFQGLSVLSSKIFLKSSGCCNFSLTANNIIHYISIFFLESPSSRMSGVFREKRDSFRIYLFSYFENRKALKA